MDGRCVVIKFRFLLLSRRSVGGDFPFCVAEEKEEFQPAERLVNSKFVRRCLMARFAIVCLLWNLIPASCFGQGSLSATPPDPRGPAVPATDVGPASRMTQQQRLQMVWLVTPASEPKPVFRYRFWPHESSLHPGSAQLHYFRAMTFMNSKPDVVSQITKLSEWDADPDLTEERAVLDAMKSSLEELQALALCEDISWGARLRDIRGPAGYYVSFEDVQPARNLARLLRIQARVQVRENDFEAAARTIQAGHRLAALIGNGESVIQRLIGVALNAIMRDTIEYMIQTPGCPNLYWAMATVPQPLVQMRRSIELELDGIHRAFPVLREAAAADWNEEQANHEWVAAITQLKELTGKSNDPANLQILTAMDITPFVEPAALRLKAGGWTDDAIAKMAASGIVMADAATELDRMADELMKGELLPRSQRQRTGQAAFQLYTQWIEKEMTTSAGALFASVLFPGILQIDVAEGRCPTMYRRLMTLEAIRMYAASHSGEAPESLDQLTAAPALNSLETEQPFEYRIEQNGDERTFVLSGDIPGFEIARDLRFRIVK